jgi:hypothetical protein
MNLIDKNTDGLLKCNTVRKIIKSEIKMLIFFKKLLLPLKTTLNCFLPILV